MNPWEMDDSAFAAASAKNPWEMDDADIELVSSKQAPKKVDAEKVRRERTALESMERAIRAGFPRTTRAMDEGDSFAPLSGVLDVASIPGRLVAASIPQFSDALVGEASADKFIDSFGRTTGTAKYAAPRIASTILRAPENLLLPGIGMGAGKAIGAARSALPVAHGASRIPAVVQEALQIGTEAGVQGAITGQETGAGFSTPAAAITAAVGAVPGAKYIADLPALESRMSQEQIAENLYKIFKPLPTLQKSNSVLSDPRVFQKLAFEKSPYGESALLEGVTDWRDLLANFGERNKAIAERSTSALGDAVFSSPVAREEILAAPLRAEYAIAGDLSNAMLGRGDADAIANSLTAPFADIYSAVAEPIVAGARGNRAYSNDMYNMLRETMTGTPAESFDPSTLLQQAGLVNSAGEIGTAPLRDVVKLEKQLRKTAQESYGKFSKVDRKLSDEGKAYDYAIGALKDFTASKLPKDSEAANAYYSAQHEWADLLPYRNALADAVLGRLSNNKAVSQTQLGRLNAILPEAMGVAKSAVFAQQDPIVDIANALALYRAAPAKQAKAQAAKQFGAYRGSTIPTALRFSADRAAQDRFK